MSLGLPGSLSGNNVSPKVAEVEKLYEITMLKQEQLFLITDFFYL